MGGSLHGKGERTVGKVVTELDWTEVQQCLDPALPNDAPPTPSLPVKETLSKYKSRYEFGPNQGLSNTNSGL